MSPIPPPPDPSALLAGAALGPKKSWGQNFLRDQTVLARIAAATEAGPETPVVELGAGLGALTYHLLARGGAVIAIERDRDLAPLLRQALAWAEGLTVREADAAELDYAALAEELGGPLVVAGNLPYQLSSRILVGLAAAQPYVRRAVVLVQREVAERLAATPGGRTYGLLSVLVQRSFDVTVLCRVGRGAFLPPPRVDSCVMRLTAHGRPTCRDGDLVRAARAAFSQRRKTLKNALAAGLGLGAGQRDQLAVSLSEAGIDPAARAETLAVADFAHLGAVLRRAGLLT